MVSLEVTTDSLGQKRKHVLLARCWSTERLMGKHSLPDNTPTTLHLGHICLVLEDSKFISTGTGPFCARFFLHRSNSQSSNLLMCQNKATYKFALKLMV